jgi:hypothetical protein
MCTSLRMSRVGRVSPSGVSRHHMSTMSATVRTIASAYATLSRPTRLRAPLTGHRGNHAVTRCAYSRILSSSISSRRSMISRVGRVSPSGVSRHHMSTMSATVRTIASAYAALSRPTRLGHAGLRTPTRSHPQRGPCSALRCVHLARICNKVLSD